MSPWQTARYCAADDSRRAPEAPDKDVLPPFEVAPAFVGGHGPKAAGPVGRPFGIGFLIREARPTRAPTQGCN